jgi:hypothetical protein
MAVDLVIDIENGEGTFKLDAAVPRRRLDAVEEIKPFRVCAPMSALVPSLRSCQSGDRPPAR